MPPSSKELGKKAEEIASSYLIEKKYKIISRNFSTPYGEIDIVALSPNEEYLCIVEVRSSFATLNRFDPLFSITKRKIEHIKKATLQFLSAQGTKFQDKIVRFDIILVYNQKDRPKIEHIEGAFL